MTKACVKKVFDCMQLVSNEAELLPAAEAALKQVLQHPDVGRHGTKATFRDAFAQEWMDFAVGEAQSGFEMLQDPRIVAALEATLQRLAGRKSKL